MLGPVLLLTLVETSSWTGKKHNNILETWHVFVILNSLDVQSVCCFSMLYVYKASYCF